MLDVGALYEAHCHHVWAYFAQRLRGVDDAVLDDLTMDVFERAIRAVPRYREQGVAPKYWLFRIAHNLLVDRFREGNRRVTILRLGDLKPYVEHVGTDDHAACIDTRTAVAAALPRLTDAQRAVIVARYLEGRSTRQAADAVGTTENGVKKLQQRGLVNLRKYLGAA